jgi:hypothetical protein
MTQEEINEGVRLNSALIYESDAPVVTTIQGKMERRFDDVEQLLAQLEGGKWLHVVTDSEVRLNIGPAGWGVVMPQSRK